MLYSDNIVYGGIAEMVWVKQCSKCKVAKTLDNFAKDTRQSSGYCPSCKQCESATRKRYRDANKDAIRAAQRDHYVRNRDIVIAKTKAYAAANREVVRAQKAADYMRNREAKLAKQKSYYANNRGARLQYVKDNASAFRARTAIRNAVKRKATPAWANVSKIDAFYFAADFLSMVTGEWYHVDHIVPLQSKIVCGMHCEENLQILPASENIAKGNRYWPDMP